MFTGNCHNQQSIVRRLKDTLREKRNQVLRKEVNVFVETAEKWKPHKKPKKEKIAKPEPSKRLDTWIDRKHN